jgi:hypothetical protein
VVAGAVAAFVMAWSVIAWSGSLGTADTTSTAAGSTGTHSTQSTQSQDEPSAVTTGQS